MKVLLHDGTRIWDLHIGNEEPQSTYVCENVIYHRSDRKADGLVVYYREVAK